MLIKYIYQILGVLDYRRRLTPVHNEVGLCHKDLKPQNVLIDLSDNVQLIDFGNSEFFFDESKHIYCHFEGTLNYMPPEYFRLSTTIGATL